MTINKDRAEKTKELLKRLGGLPPDPVFKPQLVQTSGDSSSANRSAFPLSETRNAVQVETLTPSSLPMVGMVAQEALVPISTGESGSTSTDKEAAFNTRNRVFSPEQKAEMKALLAKARESIAAIKQKHEQ